jgi:hypothetical protein
MMLLNTVAVSLVALIMLLFTIMIFGSGAGLPLAA